MREVTFSALLLTTWPDMVYISSDSGADAMKNERGILTALIYLRVPVAGN